MVFLFSILFTLSSFGMESKRQIIDNFVRNNDVPGLRLYIKNAEVKGDDYEYACILIIDDFVKKADINGLKDFIGRISRDSITKYANKFIFDDFVKRGDFTGLGKFIRFNFDVDEEDNEYAIKLIIDNYVEKNDMEGLNKYVESNVGVNTESFKYAQKFLPSLATHVIPSKTVIQNPTNEDVLKISDELEKGDNHYFLSMMEGSINDLGARRLAEVLLKNTALRDLSLSLNKITDSGVIMLAKALERNTSLTYLSLYGNFNITNEGAKALAEMLTKNRTLKILVLGRCQVTNVDCFIKAIETNNVIKIIKLRALNVKNSSEIEKNSQRRLRLLPLGVDDLSIELLEENNILQGQCWK
jgi:hypothetical protein